MRRDALATGSLGCALLLKAVIDASKHASPSIDPTVACTVVVGLCLALYASLFSVDDFLPLRRPRETKRPYERDVGDFDGMSARSSAARAFAGRG